MLPSGCFSSPFAQNPFLSLSLVQVKLVSGHWWSWLSKDT